MLNKYTKSLFRYVLKTCIVYPGLGEYKTFGYGNDGCKWHVFGFALTTDRPSIFAADPAHCAHDVFATVSLEYLQTVL